VRVLDQSGQTLLVKEVTSGGLTVGRQPKSDIVLPAAVVSRRHLHVLWDGQQVSVKDLGSTHGTLLGDVELPPQASQIWMSEQVIHIGPFELRLEGVSSGGAQSAPEELPQAFASGSVGVSQTQISATMVRSDRIGLAVSSRMLSITPGQPTSIQITLTNLGDAVDWFTIIVEGVPQEWIQGSVQEVQLHPGTEKSVEVHVNVAREAQSLAQVYPVGIWARSHRKPSEAVTVQSRWTILPCTEDTLRSEPHQANGHGGVTYAVTVQNGGNTPAHYALRGDDGKQEMNLEQDPPFQVHARAADRSIPLSVPVSVPGEFVNKARRPIWLLPIILVVFAIAVSMAYVFGLLPYTLSTSTSTQTVGPTATPTSSWTVRNSGTDMYLLGVTTSGSQFVAVGYSGTILTSSDAISWATQNSGITNNLQSVIWAKSQAESQFVAVGDAGTILTSPDGVNWTQQISPTIKNLNAVTWTESQFVAVGDFGTILTSSNGINWTPQDSGTIYKLGGVAKNNSLLVAVGGPSGGAQGNAAIFTSPLDGTHWTPQRADTTSFLRRVVWSGSRFVAVGNHGAIFTSTDGINWVRDDVGTVIDHLGDVTWSGSEFVVVGDSGTILTSADGIKWTRQSSVTLRYLRKVIWSHPRYIAVGANGTILTSR
jgi:hypothetical protein